MFELWSHRFATWAAASFLALTVAATAAEPVSVKMKLEEPVLPELMGGCSLKCGFAWTVTVQWTPQGKPTAVKALNDESADTALIAPAGVSGVGAKVKVSFPRKLPAEVEGQVPFYGLDVINGAWKSEELWEQQARLKKVRLYYNDRPFRDVTFADSRRWQRLVFPDFMVRSGDSLTLEVLEIFPGARGNGLAISELVLQGAH